MSRERITIGGCPKCGSDLMTCQQNHFKNDELEIFSWEHKCPDCGFRQTEAFRSDDEDEDDNVPLEEIADVSADDDDS